MKIDALIFDLDGTLVNTLPDLAYSVNYALKLNGFPVHADEDYKNFLGNGSKVLIQKAIGCKVGEVVFRHVFDDYLNYYLAHVADRSKAFPGMVKTLQALQKRGYRLFVLTNKPDDAANELISVIFGDLFTSVIGNSGKIPTKPDPTGLNLLMSQNGLSSDRVAYFGDSDVDMILADKASIKYKIACLYGYRSKAELMAQHPYKAISSPSEILSLDFLQE